MKKFVVYFGLFFISLINFSTNVIAQNYNDSLKSLEITTIGPNPEFLKTVPSLYYPTDSEFMSDPEFVIPTEVILSDRYKCNIKYLKSSMVNGVLDPIFEVTVNHSSFGVLSLHLSSLEKLFQEGTVTDQVNLYCKFTDLGILSEVGDN